MADFLRGKNTKISTLTDINTLNKFLPMELKQQIYINLKNRNQQAQSKLNILWQEYCLFSCIAPTMKAKTS